MFGIQEQRSGASYGEILHHPFSCNSIEDKSDNVEAPGPHHRKSKLLGLLRVQPAIVLLFHVLSDEDPFIYGPPLILTSPLIFWDLVGLACSLSRFPPIPLEINLLLELIFFGCFVYLSYEYFLFVPDYQVDYGVSNRETPTLGAILSLLVLLTGSVRLYFDIRAYPTHRRYKLDYRKTKPLIAFTKTGAPVAFFQPSQETILQRLSIDSLQELHHD
ncbi:hypothetical protein F5Y03DRAFT_169935 [Xylaria venustula]|nr:hypothetical protein F5Y03DRAFT_169935 [Xylaria venustula]